jgi:hypothetical protein
MGILLTQIGEAIEKQRVQQLLKKPWNNQQKKKAPEKSQGPFIHAALYILRTFSAFKPF